MGFQVFMSVMMLLIPLTMIGVGFLFMKKALNRNFDKDGNRRGR